MEIKIKKIIPPQPQKEIEVTLKILCDICKQSEGQLTDSEEVEWKVVSPYEICTTVLKYEDGITFFQHSDIKRLSFHVCPQCFQNKLVPWFQEQGAEPTKKETD